MLETRMPSISTRTRRLDAPSRPAARTSGAARSSARGSSVVGNTALDTAPERSAPRSAPAPRQSRLGRSEMRLMGLATTCTAVVCGLLLLYLAAYAHVSQLGYAQAEARTQLRQNQLQNMSLQAEHDRLRSRQFVLKEAVSLGMTPRGSTPVSYITARSSRTGESQLGQTENARVTAEGEQEINGGKAADTFNQPSFNH